MVSLFLRGAADSSLTSDLILRVDENDNGRPSSTVLERIAVGHGVTAVRLEALIGW